MTVTSAREKIMCDSNKSEEQGTCGINKGEGGGCSVCDSNRIRDRIPRGCQWQERK